MNSGKVYLPMKILHISTHNENCGIGKYQEMYIKSMSEQDTSIKNDFFSYSPNFMIKQTKPEFIKILQELEQMIDQYDLVHIQHEFSFYQGHQLDAIVSLVLKHDKPLVSTIHTKPILSPNVTVIRTPRHMARKIKTRVINDRYLQKIRPLAKSKVVIVHNEFTKQSLIGVGFVADSIVIKPIPVPVIKEFTNKFATEINALNQKVKRAEGDVIIGALGYINEVKGTMQAVKSMSLLPSNYKLLFLGGVHPNAHNDDFLDMVTDYVVRNNLKDRVYITGFVEDDLLLNAYVQNVDIMIYPYLRNYASSSAAINNAYAASKPVIAFPAPAFKELNEKGDRMVLCQSFSYYDLAKEIGEFDQEMIKKWSKISSDYRVAASYQKLASELIEIYENVVTSK